MSIKLICCQIIKEMPQLHGVRGKILFMGVTAWFLFSNIVFGEIISIQELLEAPHLLNKTVVEIEGEVIGDVFSHDNGYWINISDSTGMIGVFMKDEELAKKIKKVGRYKTRGDWIRVQGKFFAVCPYHFERDFHADKLTVLRQGYFVTSTVSLQKRRYTAISIIICLTLAGIYFIKEHYGRRNSRNIAGSTH